MRLIDADALGNRMYHESFEKDSDLQRWDGGCWIRYKLFEQVLRAAPTIDPTHIAPSNALDISVCVDKQAVIDQINRLINDKHHIKIGTSTFRDGVIDGYARVLSMVNRLPSVQPETAKRIVGKSRNGMTLWYQCDMCNEPVDVQDNYCRGCGRRLIDE